MDQRGRGLRRDDGGWGGGCRWSQAAWTLGAAAGGTVGPSACPAEGSTPRLLVAPGGGAGSPAPTSLAAVAVAAIAVATAAGGSVAWRCCYGRCGH
jgi:hypothetical protein